MVKISLPCGASVCPGQYRHKFEKFFCSGGFWQVVPSEHPVIDPNLILDDYRQVREPPASPRYKTFLQSFLGEIVVGRYSVTITLKTGLELFPDLDTAIPVRRQEIYEGKKRPV